MDTIGFFTNIQRRREEYRRLVEVFEKEKIEDFSLIALKGSQVCEAMLEYILDKHNIEVHDGLIALHTERGWGTRKETTISYCVHNSDIIPEECRDFLNLIRRHRNQAVHVGNLNAAMIREFSRALDYFTAWFGVKYINRENIGSDFDEIKNSFFFAEDTILKEQENSSKSNTEDLIRELLKKIEEQTETIDNLRKQVGKIDERGERIEFAMSEINRKLDELTEQISAYQSLVERQIEKADSEIEKDRIIQGYVDECIEKIIKTTDKTAEKRALELEKKKLIISIGEKAWNKMDNASKTFLVTAKHMYNHLILIDNHTDYSGVCILVTKAIEVELSKRFYTSFLNYLRQTYRNDYSKYHTALLYRRRSPIKPEKFTMGSIAFVLCYLEDNDDSDAEKKQNKKCLLEYSKKQLFPQKNNSEIEKILKEYAMSVEKIRTSFRNPSAHTNELKRIDAEECFNLVLDVEKLLKKMLDSFSN